jgi:hypothetical protein
MITIDHKSSESKEFHALRSVAIFNIKEYQQEQGGLLLCSPLTVTDQCRLFIVLSFKRKF